MACGHLGVREPSLVPVAAIERPLMRCGVVPELCDLEVAPFGPVVGMPRCPPLQERDRGSADEKLQANLIARVHGDAMLAESFDPADGGELDEVGQCQYLERSRPPNGVSNAGATPSSFQNTVFCRNF
jgi:hypothetical protein